MKAGKFRNPKIIKKSSFEMKINIFGMCAMHDTNEYLLPTVCKFFYCFLKIFTSMIILACQHKCSIWRLCITFCLSMICFYYYSFSPTEQSIFLVFEVYLVKCTCKSHQTHFTSPLPLRKVAPLIGQELVRKL